MLRNVEFKKPFCDSVNFHEVRNSTTRTFIASARMYLQWILDHNVMTQQLQIIQIKSTFDNDICILGLIVLIVLFVVMDMDTR